MKGVHVDFQVKVKVNREIGRANFLRSGLHFVYFNSNYLAKRIFIYEPIPDVLRIDSRLEPRREEKRTTEFSIQAICLLRRRCKPVFQHHRNIIPYLSCNICPARIAAECICWGVDDLNGAARSVMDFTCASSIIYNMYQPKQHYSNVS